MPGLRERKKQELRHELSRVGIDQFIARGFATTTVDDIVAPLGASKRTFFRYFETKEDVVFAWYDELTHELVDTLRARPKHEPPYEAVCATLMSLLRLYDADRTRAIALQRLTRETPALVGKSFEKRAIWERELAAVLVSRLAKSATRQLRAEVIVATALAAFTHAVDQWAVDEGATDLHALVGKAFAFAKAL
ncbi:MAG TPA: TetR family transcriptional regulator [Kofleriaceae bacterium]|jgi:AcrR family transcriptional regulator